MKSSSWFLLAASIGVVASGAAWAVETDIGRDYWSAPYNPTRLEWLVMELNASAGHRCHSSLERDCVDVSFGITINTPKDLSVDLIKGDSEIRLRETAVQSVQKIRIATMSSGRWSGNVPPVRIFLLREKNQPLDVYDCRPQRVTAATPLLLAPVALKAAQLQDVCESLRRVPTTP